MGTERSTEYSCPCYCGEGIFEIECCEVDHGWPTSTPNWLSGRIECIDCANRFELRESAKSFYLIEKTELERLNEISKKIEQCEKEFFLLPGVREVLNRFASCISSKKTLAAMHRFLSEYQFESVSLAMFRKRWSGAELWVGSHIRSNNFLNVCRALALDLGCAEKEKLSEILGFKTEVAAGPKFFGEAIYTVL